MESVPICVKKDKKSGVVTDTCNPSYLGGRDKEEL
jgi:hypothetical protein